MDRFSDIIGQEKAKRILDGGIKSDRLSHAYLFYGPEGVGKESLAIRFIRTILCDNIDPPCNECRSCLLTAEGKSADWSVIFPQKSASSDKERQNNIDEGTAYLQQRLIDDSIEYDQSPSLKITIDVIRSLSELLELPPNDSKKRVALILSADRMGIEAANAFLKTLEEPRPGVVIVLTTTRIEYLPRTIVSRCQLVPFRPLTDFEISSFLMHKKGLSQKRADEIAILSRGSLKSALLAASDSYAELERMIDELLAVWHNPKPDMILEIGGKLGDYVNRSYFKDFLGLLRGKIRAKLIATEDLRWSDKLEDIETLAMLGERNINLRLAFMALSSGQNISSLIDDMY